MIDAKKYCSILIKSQFTMSCDNKVLHFRLIQETLMDIGTVNKNQPKNCAYILITSCQETTTTTNKKFMCIYIIDCYRLVTKCTTIWKTLLSSFEDEQKLKRSTQQNHTYKRSSILLHCKNELEYKISWLSSLK
jgi:hypothetical protein